MLLKIMFLKHDFKAPQNVGIVVPYNSLEAVKKAPKMMYSCRQLNTRQSSPLLVVVFIFKFQGPKRLCTLKIYENVLDIPLNDFELNGFVSIMS